MRSVEPSWKYDWPFAVLVCTVLLAPLIVLQQLFAWDSRVLTAGYFLIGGVVVVVQGHYRLKAIDRADARPRTRPHRGPTG